MAEMTLAAIAGTVAMKFVDRIADWFVDKLKEALGFGGGKSVEEMLEETVRRLALIIDEKLDEQWHEESLAILASVTCGVAEWHAKTREML